MLPVHAACTADDGVFQRVMSSYTANVTALVRATEPVSAEGPPVFVGVQHVPGSTLADLPAVAGEAATVRGAFRGVRELLADHASRDEVVRAVATAPLVHFARHAQPSPDNPRDAGLELWDGRLTVREIAERRTTSRPQLAYLSACHTAVGSAVLPDEVITVAAAFLVAGCRNVVGTLWAVGDTEASTVAADFYARLVSGYDPAAALHSAVGALRDRHPKRPWIWAPYLHLGGGTGI